MSDARIILKKPVSFCASLIVLVGLILTGLVNTSPFQSASTANPFTLTAACDQSVFPQAPTVETDVLPNSTYSEDFDGDGKNDLAVFGNKVSVLRNSSTLGTVQFAPKVTLNTTHGGLGVTSADLDGDNKKDIITANFSNSSISVLLNSSTGVGVISFDAPVDFTAGSSPRSVIAADFDGDGKLDIATSNSGNNTVTVLKNTSTGPGNTNFDTPLSIGVGTQARALVSADLNGDNKLDIALVNDVSGSANVTVLRNTRATVGVLSFAPKVDFSTGVSGGFIPSAIVAFDIDGDSKLDVVAAQLLLNRISVLRNTTVTETSISFDSPVGFQGGFGANKLIAADLDMDGKRDLATADFYGNTSTQMRNTSAPGSIDFQSRQAYVAGHTPTSVTGEDFDGDSNVDLVISNQEEANVTVLQNTGSGAGMIEFVGRSEIGIEGFTPFSIASADFDLDGTNDLMTPNSNSNDLAFLRNQSMTGGDLEFAPETNIPATGGANPYWADAADFDGDGKPDAVVSNSNLNNVSVFRNTTTGPGVIAFALPQDFAVGIDPRFVEVGDFDGDTKPDIAALSRNSGDVSILRNTSSGAGNISFASQETFAVNDSDPISLTVQDLNDDGKPDIVVANNISTAISVLQNNSPGPGMISFAPKVDFTGNSNPLFVASDDFDGDGKPDIVITNRIGSNGYVTVFRNTSVSGAAITFAPIVDFQVATDPEILLHLTVANIDNDEKPDIFVINSNEGISLLKNSSTGAGNIDFAPEIDIRSSVATSALVTADLNRDGKDDVGYASYNSNNVGTIRNPCRVGGTQFDFEGDGKADVSVFRPGPGEWWYQRSSDTLVTALQFGSVTDIPVPADYTGDGATDIAFFRPSTGQWFVLRSEDSSFFAFGFGSNGDQPAPGDFDGDGIDDPAVFRESIGQWFILRSSDGGSTVVPFGVPGDKALVGDYDGDGTDDVGVFRSSLSQYWLLRSTGLIAYQFGTIGDQAFAADFTGDGTDDAGFFRPATGQWFILRSDDQSFFAFPFGSTGDIPAPADYDGDGTADPTVFRPSSATWFSIQSTNGSVITPFGANGDRPVANSYVVD